MGDDSVGNEEDLFEEFLQSLPGWSVKPLPPLPEPDETIENLIDDLLPVPPPIVENRAPIVPLTNESCAQYSFLSQDEVQQISVRLVRKLLRTGPFSFLDLESPFEGDGVYALYYQGDDPLYVPLRSMGSTCPIYVGKAGQTVSKNSLASRLKEHRVSLQQTNLGLENFTFRFVCLPLSMVEFAEASLIRLYKPLWNCYLKGFGERAGANYQRNTQLISLWDTYHPGRFMDSRRPRNPGDVEQTIRNAVPICRRDYEMAKGILGES